MTGNSNDEKAWNWFRVYNDLVDDAKVQQLPAESFKFLVNLWCVASKNNGQIPAANEVAFRLRLTLKKAENLLAKLEAAGLIHPMDGGFTPHNWDKHQYKSDRSRERTKRYRDRQRDAHRDVTGDVTGDRSVTAPESESESESDSESDNRERVEAPAAPPPLADNDLKKKKPERSATRLTDDWKPTSADVEFAKSQGLTAVEIDRDEMKFRNHFTNEGTTRKDWSKTWQNWVIRTAETLGRSPIAPGQKGKPTIFDTHVFLREDSAEFKAWKDYRSVRGLGLAPCSDPSDKTKQGSWFPTKMPPDEEFVRVGTPRFEAWESHLKSRNVRLVIVDHPLDGTKGTYVPLDWSPSPQAKAA